MNYPITIHTRSIAACLFLAVLLGTGGICAALADTAAPVAESAIVYTNPTAPLEARISDLLGRMTLPEKLSILYLDSDGTPQLLNTPPVPRLGIPSLRTADSPAGIKDGFATAFPMEVVMGSTWDPALIREVGAAIGAEAKAKNRQVVYGPCINIQRTPQSGRYFENFSEDPYLTAQMAVGYIQGMQSQNVASCVKHYVCNDQESGRHTITVEVDERPLHEIYLTPFEAAIKQAHVWALMPSVSHVNSPSVFIAQNKPLLGDLLKTQWGWDGLIISDWGSVHDTVNTANAGTDIEMPTPTYFTPWAFNAALQNGQVTQATIDDKVRRILRVIVRTGLLDGPKPLDYSAVNSPAHQALARKTATEGMILLKNAHGILPLNRTTIKSIALIGPNARDTQLGGRWSAEVNPYYTVSVLDGIRKKAGDGVTVSFAQGCPRVGAGSPGALSEAAALAAKSDIAVVVVGTDNNYEGEEIDPPDLHLPGDQDKLIQTVAAANKNTIVVLNAGTPLLMDKWLPQVPGLLESWYAGQESGNAVADILFGDANPSGKLAGTFAIKREDYPDWGNYPGTNDVVHYAEGVYVGYRHLDKHHITPLFPFGFGLSYTTFAYSGLKVPASLKRGGTAIVYVTVQNTGKRAGDEIAQLYLHDLAPKVDRPVRELKGFHRVSLLPGQKAVLAFPLDERSFAYWDAVRHRWQTNPGPYAVEIGASSRDTRAQGVIRVQ